MFKKGNKRGQLTIFIIVAILIVAGVILIFSLREKKDNLDIPKDFQPAYNHFLSCLENKISTGVNILESQGGYIILPEFEAGSSYMPFSSQLSFLGNPIPYWYYVSGNNIEKEQIPSKREMGRQLEEFIDESIRNCDFKEFSNKGIISSLGVPKSKVEILDSRISVKLEMPFSLEKGEEHFLLNSHFFSFDSKLGSLYDSAKKIYSFEQKNLFLEKYSLDVLRSYAPVDGVEIGCSPKIWEENKIYSTLDSAIEGNILALKSRGKKDDYFAIKGLNLENGIEARFINSRNWSRAYEISPSEGDLLIAAPVGNQAGMGILGFCYIPYHFVYDVKYPVLVQVGDVYSDKGEVFQFPLAVIIQSNQPRKSLDVKAVNIDLPQFCDKKNNFVNVNIFNENLQPIDANISYECFGRSCFIGASSEGSLNKKFPGCVNGYVKASADGFEDSRELFSSVEGKEISILMTKRYEKNILLKVDNKDYFGNAVISFISKEPGRSKTVIYPQKKKVKLSEGEYDIQVFIFGNSTLELPATKSQQCIEIPRSGIAGFFGATQERCIQIEVPKQMITNSLIGGGKENYYILEDELKKGDLEINSKSFPLPKTIEQLQGNYQLFEEQDLGVNFR